MPASRGRSISHHTAAWCPLRRASRSRSARVPLELFGNRLDDEAHERHVLLYAVQPEFAAQRLRNAHRELGRVVWILFHQAIVAASEPVLKRVADENPRRSIYATRWPAYRVAMVCDTRRPDDQTETREPKLTGSGPARSHRERLSSGAEGRVTRALRDREGDDAAMRHGFERNTPGWLLAVVIVVSGLVLAVLGQWVLDTIQSFSG
jgi:hypothetical protein